MNEPRPHPNVRDPENRIAKEDLKELNITTYINKVHLPFRWLNHTNSMVEHALLEAILCLVTSQEFFWDACE